MAANPAKVLAQTPLWKRFDRLQNSRCHCALLAVLAVVSVMTLNGCAGFMSSANTTNSGPVAPVIFDDLIGLGVSRRSSRG